MIAPVVNWGWTSTSMVSMKEALLQAYGELAVRIGLNLQPGQRLLIVGPSVSGGASLEAAPLVREIAASAYRAGAPLVEAMWGDEAMQLQRLEYAPRDSFGQFSGWLPDALVRHVEAGHAVISIYANNPDLLKDAPPPLIGQMQMAASIGLRAFRELIGRNQTNWTVVAAAGAGWASKVFPHLPPDEQLSSLWNAIARLCRLDDPEPIAAWERHLAVLAARRDELNRKRYAALKYSGPGTDLTIGLPDGHLWVSGRSATRAGVPFVPNLPTEEVFTMPHAERVNGVVRATKPLSYGGTLIEGFGLRFVAGRIVEATAERGETVLRQLVATDAGASRLGELALVAHSTPVAQSGLLFYNTLFDENAACHIAVGAAYKFTLGDGDMMDDETFERAGGNRSGVHVDLMIGSSAIDIDGILHNGAAEPLMRSGEWTDEPAG
jgi:aminopeptidase